MRLFFSRRRRHTRYSRDWSTDVCCSDLAMLAPVKDHAGRVSLADELKILTLLIFFSSRRRHTRYWRDWSSDVCSSDLVSSAFAVRDVDALQVSRATERAAALTPCGRRRRARITLRSRGHLLPGGDWDGHTDRKSVV